MLPLNRLEQNQILSYQTFKECNNTNMILAILWNNNVYFIDFSLLQFYDKSINLKNFTPNITDWDKFVDSLKNK